jgi:hypothetical protein
MNGTTLDPRDHRALVATAGQFFVNGAMTSSFIARAPQIRDRIGVSVEEFGLLLTVTAVFGLLGSLVAGRVIHAGTTRRVLQAGAVVMVLSLPIIGAARGPAVWLAGMFAYMFVDVLVDISMNLHDGRPHADTGIAVPSRCSLTTPQCRGHVVRVRPVVGTPTCRSLCGMSDPIRGGETRRGATPAPLLSACCWVSGVPAEPARSLGAIDATTRSLCCGFATIGWGFHAAFRRSRSRAEEDVRPDVSGRR